MAADIGGRKRLDLGWLVRDAQLVIATRALRTFGYGTTSVLLAEMLEDEGFSPARIGILLAVAAVGCVTASILMGLFADRLGRRWSLLFTSVLMGAAGLTFALSHSYPLLLVAAFIGTISPSTNDNTPFSGVEQSILAQTCASSRHATLYTCYNSAAQLAGALGGLAAAGLSMWTGADAGAAAFILYALLAGVIGLMFLSLSPAAEVETAVRATAAKQAENIAPRTGRRAGTPEAQGRTAVRISPRMRRLAALFAVDAFAGGLAVQAILAFWFHQRYGVSTAQLGVLFFAANLLPALAQLAAPALAARGGLLATMLGPHFLANLCLLCVPLAPTFGTAAALLLTRQALSKIDVPARQAFTAAVVDPVDRTAAASLTTVARSTAVSASPLTSSMLLSNAALVASGAPLLLSAGLGIVYDVTMWRGFRNVPLKTSQGPHRGAPRKEEERGEGDTAEAAPVTAAS